MLKWEIVYHLPGTYEYHDMTTIEETFEIYLGAEKAFYQLEWSSLFQVIETLTWTKLKY